MAEQESKSVNIPWPTIMALAALVGGAMFFIPPLNSSRPTEESGPPVDSLGDQSVSARLWQDPIKAADDDYEQVLKRAEARAKSLKEGSGNEAAPSASARADRDKESHDPSILRQEICDRTCLQSPPKHILVMPVACEGENYAEAVEGRLRFREAVVAGLGVSGFSPRDGEHLGYTALPWQWRTIDREDHKSSVQDQMTAKTPAFSLVVPFEWFDAIYGDKTLTRYKAFDSVLVLWVRDEALGDLPLARWGSLLANVIPPKTEGSNVLTNDQLSVTIIGPRTSTTLRKMLAELSGSVDCTTQCRLSGVSMLSATSTASGYLLTYDLSDRSIPNYSDPVKGLFVAHLPDSSFRRTILTDDQLAGTLMQELQRRGVDTASDRIALISEFDTFYGRCLPVSVAAAATGKQETSLIDDSNWPKERLFRYGYLRGIDGRVPRQKYEKGADIGGSETDGSKTDGSKTEKKAQASLEMPEGLDQSDYLRRLAESLVERDREFRRKDGEEHGIRAVGVLGSDVYDRLQILRALRPQLPDALFFTFDFDARYVEPAEWKECHNLIAISPFGNQLKTEYQRHAPPFRDSYQTSVYATVLDALGWMDDVNPASGPPRIFEIGRSLARDLSVSDPLNQKTVQPDVPPLTGWWNSRRAESILRLSLYAAGLLLWLWLLLIHRMPSHPISNLVTRTRPFLIWSVPLIITIIWLSAAGQGPGGKPFLLLSGISIWPTEAMRLFAMLLSIHFLCRAYLQLRHNRLMIEEKYPSLRTIFLTTWNLYERVRSVTGPWRSDRADLRSVPQVWRDYAERGRLASRAIRVIPATALFAIFGYLLIGLLGRPLVPIRGEFSQNFDNVTLTLSIIVTTLLTFVVVDASWVNTDLINVLSAETVRWDFESLRGAAFRLGMPIEDVGDYLKIKLLAERTTVVSDLIYYPFLILAILIVSRNSYFDNWSWPAGLVLIIVIQALIAVTVAVLLRNAAERLRQTVLEKIRSKRAQAISRGKAPRTDSLHWLETEIENEQRGAFATLSTHPIIRAILLPSGGVGIWAVLEYLAKT